MSKKIYGHYDDLSGLDDGLTFTDPSHTQQHFRDECDINEILMRYSKTGVLPHVNPSPPEYRDLAQELDYHQAMTFLVHAQDQFNELPARTRARFGNDPGQLLEFLQDPENTDEAVKLGLIPPLGDPVGAKPHPEGPPVTPLVVTGGTDCNWWD